MSRLRLILPVTEKAIVPVRSRWPKELQLKFLVAFAFAGEQRELVRAIAEAVEKELGQATVFLDEWFEYLIAGHDADLKLQQIYVDQSELVVVCVSERYGGKPWTRAEHEAICARLMVTRTSREERDKLRILPIRVGEGEIEGILFNTIVPDVRERSPTETAELILNRLRLIGQHPATEKAEAPIHSFWPKEHARFEYGLADSAPNRDKVFISYSHRDTRWRDDLDMHLKPYVRDGSVISWSDEAITPGSKWFDEIKSALTNTKIAVLLVTPAFLASPFIYQHELGPLLKEAEQGGVRLLWVPVRASAYAQTALKDYQAILSPAKPLAGLTRPQRDQAWVKICERIRKAVDSL